MASSTRLMGFTFLAAGISSKRFSTYWSFRTRVKVLSNDSLAIDLIQFLTKLSMDSYSLWLIISHHFALVCQELSGDYTSRDIPSFPNFLALVEVRVQDGLGGIFRRRGALGVWGCGNPCI